jgi:DNA end-binding protein Ku
VSKTRAAEPPSNVVNLMEALKRSISSEKGAAKSQKASAKKADDLRKQPQFKLPIEGGQAKQDKPAAKPVPKPVSATKSKRKSA